MGDAILSYNGSGTFQINTTGQPVVAGTVISSTAFNSLTADLANGLSTAITKDGQTTVTNNIPMAGFKITGLGAATVGTDAARYSQIQGGTDKLITVTGTDTLTGSLTPALTAYAAGNQFSFVVANTNTGAVTINIDGVGVKSITKSGSTALAAGDLTANSIALIEYDGTRFQLINVATGNVTGPASSTANAIPTFSGTTGKIIQNNSGVKIVSNNITMDGSTSGTLTVAASAIAGTNTLTLPATTGTVAVSSVSTDYILSPYTGFKNRIINGAMAVDQRNAGASQTITAAAALAYTVDRWYAWTTGANGTTQRVSGTAPSQYALKFTGATSNTLCGIAQRIEQLNSYDLASGAVTISAYMTASTNTTITAILNGPSSTADTFGTIASPTVTQIATTTFSVTTTRTLFTWTISAASMSGFNKGLELIFKAGSGLGNAVTWTIESVQLEAGSNATSFEYRDYGRELEMCQRYYEVIGNSSTAQTIFIDYYANAANSPSGAFNWNYRQVKRASPTVANIGTFTTSNTGAVAVNATDTTAANILGQASAAGRAYWYNNANSGFSSSAEL